LLTLPLGLDILAKSEGRESDSMDRRKGRSGLRLVEGPTGLTGEQVYRDAARLTADFLKQQLGDLSASDRLYDEIEADVYRLRVLADSPCPQTRDESPLRCRIPGLEAG